MIKVVKFNFSRISREIIRDWGRYKHGKLEYFAIVDPETLEKKQTHGGTARILIAARIGKTRLIDNIDAGTVHKRPG